MKDCKKYVIKHVVSYKRKCTSDKQFIIVNFFKNILVQL